MECIVVCNTRGAAKNGNTAAHVTGIHYISDGRNCMLFIIRRRSMLLIS